MKPTTVLPADRLALRPRDAARALGISERCLWSLTQRGEVPHVKIGGRLVLYPRAALAAWLDRLATRPPVRPAEPDNADDELAAALASADRALADTAAIIAEIQTKEVTHG